MNRKIIRKKALKKGDKFFNELKNRCVTNIKLDKILQNPRKNLCDCHLKGEPSPC